MGATFGAVFGAATLTPRVPGALMGCLSGAVDFVTMAALIGGTEHYLPRTRAGAALEKAPFLVVFTVKAIAYSAVIMTIIGGRFGPGIAALFVNEDLAAAMRAQLDTHFPLGVALPIAFLVTFFFLLVHQMRMLVGASTLRDIVLGRYHQARVEERFFLFVDVVGSTPIAERLGPVMVNRFLNRVFHIASDPVDDSRGEVYQYVGDEMVVTWKVPVGRVSARPLACYFAIEEALARGAEEFQSEFGAVPQIRGALHAGQVITGEVGASRRAIVFHGDVMNTASRLENATRDLKRSFLASEDALTRLEGKDAYILTDLGEQKLRGRSTAVRVYAVDVRRGSGGAEFAPTR